MFARSPWIVTCLALGLTLAASPARAVKVGDPAPSFSNEDATGKTIKSADFKGKYVVLEWHNRDCPYVKKHYESGNMQKLQKEWTQKGVAWLTVVSSAPGKQGYGDVKAITEEMAKAGAAPTAVLLDSKGTTGKAFGAKTTPHMFVIDPTGKIIYNGAIDDKPMSEAKDVASAKNYVSMALEQAMSGKPVAEATTKPYGCGVKYP